MGQKQDVTTSSPEVQEWCDALTSLVHYEGAAQAELVLQAVLRLAQTHGVQVASQVNTPYVNTPLTLPDESMAPSFALFDRITDFLRWNALVIVMRAGQHWPELGGHLATYGSSATLFEVGFQYFFRGDQGNGGDLIYFQGHASPGIYARAYLEGRLSTEQLDCFRQEAFSDGLSSYPHPWLMPTFWQLPTVSMGLGPLSAIYQAQFLKYLGGRGLAETAGRHVWAFCGDGELGEPESLGALNIAARDGLDNLIFVISCNLQRLDGPVSGNSQIIQEYEGVFRGAGWHVIKIVWGADWEALFAKDTSGLLLKRVGELVDGEQQAYSSKGGAYFREHFFGRYPELLALVADKTDDELMQLTDGGHDVRYVYAAYQQAVANTDKPTVILAKTTKGFGMGAGGEGLNVTHQTKKIALAHRLQFRDRFDLPLSDAEVESLDYLPLPSGGKEQHYLQANREQLGGYLPHRDASCPVLPVPELSAFSAVLEGSGEREISSTMVFVRILSVLLKDEALKSRLVPILVDESRTFGMEGLFRQIGIYSSVGQQYEPEDRGQLMYYRESEQGQLLQQGISEAGGMASWTAAATAYANTHCPMIPFFVYYSMFGFQRFGDMVWAAGDARARGFIMGGTAGRTTLAGEGLQHQDGHNLLMFSAVPNCVSYDPCFGYELAVIIQDGLRRMYHEQEDVFYYITLMNENYIQPALPAAMEEGILRGMYRIHECQSAHSNKVRLLGGGTILREALAAAERLATEFSVSADVYSVTSFNELRRDCESVARYNRFHAKSKQSWVSKQLQDESSPVIAATDYMKLYAEQIRQDIKAPYTVLGTDGFGRSDTRAALRRFFEVDTDMIIYTALRALVDQGDWTAAQLNAAKKKLNIDSRRADPDKS